LAAGRPLPTLAARAAPRADPAVQLASLAALPRLGEFEAVLGEHGLAPLRPARLETLQVNLGKLCNQTCRHCHVDAGPDRTELMARETMEACLAALDRSEVPTVDLTGGAPELHPDFRWFVREIRARGRHVIDRCNLTVLLLAPQRGLAEFLAGQRVEIVASLPHYRQPNTDRQRGEGVFERSIEALRRLNALGYGDGSSGLRLVLVTNPVGAFLPPQQASLEAEWKREMERLHGVRFDALYCLANMPIARFLDWLVESGNLERYMERLLAAFNPAAARGVMCRNTLSVAWDGRLHDCDFNQMLDLGLAPGAPAHIRDFDPAALAARTIATDRHCFGCTAGAGSSCGGATA
jgi:radical SAM/Cys-rich protein